MKRYVLSHSYLRQAVCVAAFLATLSVGVVFAWDEYKSGIEWERPVVIDPGPPGGPPSDAVVLFNGKDLSAWDGGDQWKIEDGCAIPQKGGINTKESFGDCQIHVEWASPSLVKGKGQGRGNSGIYVMNRYEIQILDSYENETYYDGQAASIYKQFPPMVNACRKPGEWQTYDIIWTGPRFSPKGELLSKAYVTVLHNGIVVQNHTELVGATEYDKFPKYTAHPDRQPIHIQNHGNPVKFRNIWVREIKPPVGKRTAEPAIRK